MIFRTSMLTSNCSSMLMYHNHPSGLTAPSGMDVELTKRVSQAGALLGIPLRDHIIVGGGNGAEPSYSFREHYPEFFSGVYDPDFIHGLLEGRSPEGSSLGQAVCDAFASDTVLSHGRSR